MSFRKKSASPMNTVLHNVKRSQQTLYNTVLKSREGVQDVVYKVHIPQTLMSHNVAHGVELVKQREDVVYSVCTPRASM